MTHRTDFVRDDTAPTPVPLVPEIRLHTASELGPVWRELRAQPPGDRREARRRGPRGIVGATAIEAAVILAGDVWYEREPARRFDRW